MFNYDSSAVRMTEALETNSSMRPTDDILVGYSGSVAMVNQVEPTAAISHHNNHHNKHSMTVSNSKEMSLDEESDRNFVMSPVVESAKEEESQTQNPLSDTVICSNRGPSDGHDDGHIC